MKSDRSTYRNSRPAEPARLRCYATRAVGLAELLDEAHAAFKTRADVADAVWRLCCGLWSIREQASKAQWKAIVTRCREHSLLPVLHEDPYSARAFRKPRGYPGDAGVIDYLYRTSPSAEERQSLTPLGLTLLNATTSTPSGFAVRERRRVAAREIDLIASRTLKPTIMAMAAGHAREAALSTSLRSTHIGRFVALDQDQRSLDVIRSDYGALGVECLPTSVQDLLQGSRPLGDVDLIYALGLYDYLTELVSQRLTAALFSMLAPGGTLLIANFMPDIIEAGYMEAFGDWYLTYRTPDELECVASELGNWESVRRELWIDDFRCVAYLRITRLHDA